MSKKDLNKTGYLRQLQKYLKKLPKADYDDTMDYFTEYFEDVDEEGANALMEELGTPKEAARDLMANLLDRKLTGAACETESSIISDGTSGTANLSFRFCYDHRKWAVHHRTWHSGHFAGDLFYPPDI